MAGSKSPLAELANALCRKIVIADCVVVSSAASAAAFKRDRTAMALLKSTANAPSATKGMIESPKIKAVAARWSERRREIIDRRVIAAPLHVA